VIARSGLIDATLGAPGGRPESIALLLRETAEPLSEIGGAELDSLLDRIGDARVVLLGEASHGTAEFYQLRAAITRALVERRGFNLVAVEADWPDAAAVDAHVRPHGRRLGADPAFARFPTWMWRNGEFHEFAEWMREHNAGVSDPAAQVAFYGLDLYSLFTSLHAVLAYLDTVDPDAAAIARLRYGCLTPWEHDPTLYGRAAVTGGYRACEREVVAMLEDLLTRRLEYARHDGDRFLDAVGNARVVADAERYYRIMYYGSVESWNLRDRHMFETLEALLAFHGPDAKAVVWEHNSHIGDAAATEMAERGEYNIGHLCRAAFGPAAYAVGFGTDHGTVAAASNWDGPMEIKDVRPALPASYEHVCHLTEIEAFLLPLRYPARDAVRDELMPQRLERAIGVIYRPETERLSHYFDACLPRQFDEYVWVDETHAVSPLPALAAVGVPETYPFGV